MKRTVVIGEMDNSDGTFESANRVYDKSACCPTIPTCGGGGIQPKTIRKGKNMSVKQILIEDNTQRFEKRTEDGIMYVKDFMTDQCESDSEKTVEDYLYHAKDGEEYGIFKLSVRECGRLMGVRDEDIDKMMTVNSNTRCYAGFGNSIVTTVLMAIFSQLHIKGCPVWNKISEEERQVIVDDAKGVYTK